MKSSDSWLSVIFAAAVAASACADCARAETWAPPTNVEASSVDGKSRVIIVPADWKTVRNPPSQPMAIMEHETPDDGWAEVWSQPLANRVAPVRALVANGGRYLVTFDNWSSIGMGPDVIVIYDRHGALLRKLALADVLPPAYIAALPSTASSRIWGGAHALSANGDTVVLQVLVPSELPAAEGAATIPIRVRLSDGFVFVPQTKDWKRALAAAKAIVKRREASTIERAAMPQESDVVRSNRPR